MLKNILFSAILLTQIAYSKEEASIPEHKVIIIGAGFAGLETANYLQARGIDDFIILEGSDHIGGRAYTINWKDADVSLGATFVHGVNAKNPLTQLMDKWNIEAKYVDDRSGALYLADGKELSDAENKKFDDFYKTFMSSIHAKRKEPDGPTKYKNASVSDFAIDFIKSHDLNKSSQAGFIFEMVDKIEENYAADITKLSGLWFDNDEGFSDVDKVPVHGYKEMLEGISKNFTDKIVFKKVVTEIDYQNEDHIIVTTSSGEKFKGQYVVSTLPIGVLKQKTVKFTPQLPQEKLAAIEHINMGTMNKVILSFPDAFWDKEQYINYISPAYLDGNKWIKKGEWSLFYNLHYFINKPFLFALTAGDFAVETENKSDEETVEGVMTTLRKIYGADIPQPTGYIITRWGKNPFSRGSFSSLSPSALEDGKDYLNMAETIDNRLLFAGEATTDTYPSTVYGAYLSGDRVAEEILKYENEKQ